MPLRKNNQRAFHRTLYAGELESITLLKRNNDLAEGTVRAVILFDCRRKPTVKSGEPIQGEMAVSEFTTWQIPASELERTGVAYINVLDRIVDQWNRFWQPEAGQSVTTRLFENQVFVNCVRVDPPSPPAAAATTGIDSQDEVN